MQLINKKNFYLHLLLFFAFLIRLIAVYYYGDSKIEYEWAVLLDHLYEQNILAFYSFDGVLIPSVFMPPLYVYFLYLIKMFTPEGILLTNVVLYVQVILSTIGILLFFKINKLFFSKNWSIFNSFILSIFPLNVYTVTQISSITLQIFLLIFFLYLFILVSRKKNFDNTNFIYLSLIAGLLMLLRGEFYFIFLLSLVYLFIFQKIDLKRILIIFLISLLVISPYIIRNYVNFERIVLTNSLGFNLWKGNNPFSKVEGSESEKAYTHNNIDEKIKKLEKNHLYEFYLDELYFNEGISYIKEEPIIFIKRYIAKFLSFFYFNINSKYPNYYHPLFIAPIFLVGLFSTMGIFLSLRNFNYEKGYLLLYLFLTISIFSIFFILPRYKMMILPIQLIFMNYFFVEYFKGKDFFKKYK